MPTSGNESVLIARAREAGWTIRRSGDGYLVRPPHGQSFHISGTLSDEASMDVWVERFRSGGLAAAEREAEALIADAAAEAETEKMRTARKTAEKAAAEAAEAARIAEREERAAIDAQNEQAAIGAHLASGGLIMEPAQMMAPHDKETRYQRVRITPLIADKLLDANTSNRPVTPARVYAWSRQMSAGNWLYTGDSIRFDRAGTMIDGQHRLLSCVDARTAFVVDVQCGLPEDAFHVIDTGKTRSAADTLAMMGETDRFALGATVRLVGHFEDPLATAAEWHSRAGRSRRSLTNLDVARIVGADDDTADRFHAALTWATRAKACTRINKTAAAAWWFLTAVRHGGDSHPKFAEFTGRLCDGIGLPERSPILILRRFMVATMRRDAGEQLAVTIKAWNSFAQDKSMTNLMWRGDESMPTIFVCPRD